MQSIRRLLTSALQRAKIKEPVQAATVVSIVNAFLDTALEHELRLVVRAVSFRRGLLKIVCGHAVAANEVNALKAGIHEAVLVSDPTVQIDEVLIIIRSNI